MLIKLSIKTSKIIDTTRSEQNMTLRKLFIFSYVGWMERKKTLGKIHITDRKKINLNLSNKIINKTLKTR